MKTRLATRRLALISAGLVLAAGLVMADVKPRISLARRWTITNSAGVVPVSELVRQFVESECSTPHTTKAYRAALEKFVAYLGAESLPYSEITKSVISGFRDARLAVESPASASLRLNVVKAFCGWASDRYGLPNPAGDVRGAQIETPEFRGLNDNQYKALIVAARRASPLNRYIVELLVWAGLRNDEARNLSVRQISPGIEWIWRVAGKSAHKRDIPISSELRTATGEYLQWRESTGTISPYLLISQRAERLDNKTIWRVAHKIGTAAGIPEELAHPHALRHTYAYRTLARLERQDLTPGQALIKVRDWMGHTSIETTMRYLGNDKANDWDLMQDTQI